MVKNLSETIEDLSNEDLKSLYKIIKQCQIIKIELENSTLLTTLFSYISGNDNLYKLNRIESLIKAEILNRIVNDKI